MSPGVGYALASMAFAGVNDFIFKKQSDDGSGRAAYMAVVGAVWFAVFALAALVSGTPAPGAAAGSAAGPSAAPGVTLAWGLAAGALSVSANYLLIGSLRTIGAAVGATIYRMNMVVAALIGVAVLGEPAGAAKLAGFALAAAALILFAAGSGAPGERGAGRGLRMAAAASLLRAGMGVSYKLAAEAGVRGAWFLAIQGLIWLAAGAAGAVLSARGARLNAALIRRGLISGLFICGIVYFFRRALELGEASVVIPIAQMSFALTALISRFALGERLNGRKVAALCLSAIAFACLGGSG